MRKIMYTPVKPQCYYIKVGLKGVPYSVGALGRLFFVIVAFAGKHHTYLSSLRLYMPFYNIVQYTNGK